MAIKAMQSKEYSLEIGGKTLKAQFTDLADQANGSVIISYGNTSLLATAVISKKEKDSDYFPLTVEYEERFYAAGKILGGQFIRREGRPSDEAILSGRIVDRTIRPLFNLQMRYEVQVVITILSIDADDPDVLAVIGASLALGTSDIPWNGPVSATRIGKIGDSFIVNPTYANRAEEKFEMDMLACGKDGNINMIEVGSKEISDEIATESLKRASIEIEKINEFQKNIINEIGKAKKEIKEPEAPEGLEKLFVDNIEPKFYEAVFSGPGKGNITALEDEWVKIFEEKYPDAKKSFAVNLFEDKLNDLIHKEAIEKGKRPDGRGADDLRPLFAKAGGISSIIHGTGIFYRGGTHVFSALTLGGPGDSQIVDGMEVNTKKHFMHHYNFPPFSSGETGRVGGINRRATGHGNLAEKALLPVIPGKDKFPYTIRIVSESFASNGSTSMASVCASSIAFMDAGVPISKPVAGIASGIMLQDEHKYCLLTDIQGPEDHHGDMDFKVAGTRDGITAIQMDVKVDGIPINILSEALGKAKNARLKILDVIEKEISAPRADISPNAPKILSLKIKTDQIGLVIGGGGKTIKEIMEKTGAQVDIEDDGTVFFTGKNGSAEKAMQIVADMTREFVRGDKFDGTVTKIVDFGAFVRIAGNTEGLVHVSEIAPFRVEKVGTYLKEGQVVPVVVKDVDERGKISLSIKQVAPNLFSK